MAGFYLNKTAVDSWDQDSRLILNIIIFNVFLFTIAIVLNLIRQKIICE